MSSAENQNPTSGRLSLAAASAAELERRGVLVRDDRRLRPRYFDGRFLTARDLTRDQSYLMARQAELGRALGWGVCQGLQVEMKDSGHLSVRGGYGVTPTGELVALERDLTAPVADVATSQTLDVANGLKLAPGAQARARTGLFVVALRPVEWTANKVSAWPSDSDGQRRLEDGDIIEGVALTMSPYVDGGTRDRLDERRGRAAAAIFMKNQQGGLPEDALPIAMIALSGGQIRWVDSWMVRRELGADHGDALGFGLAPRGHREAWVQQYNHHLDAELSRRRSAGRSSAFAASEVFSALPPAGRLPTAAIQQDMTQIWFPPQVDVDLALVPHDELAALVEEGLFLSPLDLSADSEALAAMSVLVAVPAERSVIRQIAASALLPTLRRALTRAQGRVPRQPDPFNAVARLTRLTTARASALEADRAWRAALDQALGASGADTLWYVCRRNMNYKADIYGNSLTLNNNGADTSRRTLYSDPSVGSEIVSNFWSVFRREVSAVDPPPPAPTPPPPTEVRWPTSTDVPAPTEPVPAPTEPAPAPHSTPAFLADGATPIKVGAAEAMDWTLSFTVELWLKPEALPTGASTRVLTRRYEMDGTLMLSATGGLNWVMGRTMNTQSPVFSTVAQSLRFGEWSHVALVMDRSASPARAALYLNGALIASASGDLRCSALGEGLTVADTGPYHTPYRGGLAELRVWRIARSGEQIELNWQRRLSGADPGLVGCWPMDERAGTRLSDRGPEAWHAVVLGPALSPSASTTGPALLGDVSPAPEEGTPARYARFAAADGARAWTVSAPALLTPRDMTIEAWVRLRSHNRYGTVLTKGNTGLYLHMESETTCQIMPYSDSVLPGFKADFKPPLNTWFHVAYVRDADQRAVRLYINGCLLVAPQRVLAAKVIAERSGEEPIEIGARSTDGKYSLDADICQVRLWSVARAEAEIRADHRRAILAAPGLIGCWPMDDAEGATTLRDTSGNGNPLSQVAVSLLTGGPSLVSPPVRPWSGVALPGGDGVTGRNGVLLGDPSELELTGDLSWEAWVYVRGPETAPIWIISHGQNKYGIFRTTTGRKPYYGFGGTWRGAAGSAYVVSSSVGLKPDAWTHVAVVRDWASATLTLYVDGVVAGTSTFQIDTILHSIVDATLGAPTEQADRTALAEVRVWRVPRTAEQIQAGMRTRAAGTEAGLVACWRGDEASGSGLFDLGPGHIQGRIVGGSWTEMDSALALLEHPPALVHWPCLVLDSDTAGAELSQRPATSLTGSVTVEAWVRRDSSATALRLLGLASRGEGALELSAEGHAAFGSGAEGTDSASAREARWRSALGVGRWMHLAGVRDVGAHRHRLYLNGLLVSESELDFAAAGASTEPLRIGRQYTRSKTWTGGRGALAELRLWPTARTAEEINETRQRRLTAAEAAQTAAYWPMDEGPGATQIRDRGPSGLHLPASAGTWGTFSDRDRATAARTGHTPALVLQGKDQISIADAASLRLTGEAVTLECWLRLEGLSSPLTLLSRGAPGELSVTLRSPGQVKLNWAAGGATAYAYANQLARETGWFHLAIVRAPSATDATKASVKVYINGAPTSATTSGPPSADATTNPLVIGAGADGGFVGALTELRLWAVARTDLEIAGAWRRRLRAEEFDADRLRLYLPLDGDISAKTVTDRSGNDNHGTVTGASWTTAGPLLLNRPS